jgi:hypothetical protein
MSGKRVSVGETHVSIYQERGGRATVYKFIEKREVDGKLIILLDCLLPRDDRHLNGWTVGGAYVSEISQNYIGA